MQSGLKAVSRLFSREAYLFKLLMCIFKTRTCIMICISNFIVISERLSNCIIFVASSSCCYSALLVHATFILHDEFLKKCTKNVPSVSADSLHWG